MANKKKRKRLRLAAARQQREEKKVNDGAPGPNKRWCTQTGQWISKEDDGDDLYDVAVQMGEGKPIYTGMYRAPDDTELIDLVCKVMGVAKESEFSLFDVFKTIPDGGGVLVVRESKEWPRGVPIIRNKGITQGGRGAGNKPRIVTPLHSYSVRPRVAAPAAVETKKPEEKKAVVAATVEVILERAIPRVPYTLKQAV